MHLAQFYTLKNVFKNKVFIEWFNKHNLIKECILEPFAGSNNIISLLKEIYPQIDSKSFDIDPKNEDVQYNDSILNFPKGYKACISNPPYLASTVSSRKNIEQSFYVSKHEDLYQACLNLALGNCQYIAMIIPASYLQSNKLGFNRLSHLIYLEQENLFEDTSHPCCLILIDNERKFPQDVDFKIYSNEKYLGSYKNLFGYLDNTLIKFKINHFKNEGNVLLHKIDSSNDRIKFYKTSEIENKDYNYRSWGKFYINLEESDLNNFIYYCNLELKKYREYSKDIELTPFKGMNKINKFRRRIENKKIDQLVNKVLLENFKHIKLTTLNKQYVK